MRRPLQQLQSKGHEAGLGSRVYLVLLNGTHAGNRFIKSELWRPVQILNAIVMLAHALSSTISTYGVDLSPAADRRHVVMEHRTYVKVVS